jgi:hypothetical protein
VVDHHAGDHAAHEDLARLLRLHGRRLWLSEGRIIARANLEPEQREHGEERAERGPEHPARARLAPPLGLRSRGMRD